MDTVKIDARDVNFWYGDFHALKGISMQIEEKSVVAFIGPSGCGKSTFLQSSNRRCLYCSTTSSTLLLKL